MQISFSNAPVYNVQTALRQLAEFYPALPKVIPDGVFGPETCRCVQAFQREFGLNPTGQVDYGTWQTLFTIYQKKLQFRSPPEAVRLFRREAGAYGVGDTGEAVGMIQIFINALAKKFLNFCTVPVDGIYQETTKAEIIKFQKICMLEPSGLTDFLTWKQLLRFYERFG